MRRRAFTFAELLIVIMIIAVLTALLTSTIARAWEQARQVQCMSNIRQVTQAYLAYANDHEGRFLFLESSSGQVGIASATDNGVVILPLYPYLRSSRVFHCPSDPRDNALSYLPNDFLGPRNIVWPAYEHPFPRLLMVRNAATTYAMIEEFDLYPRTAKNPGGFVVEPAPATIWIDTPAVTHGWGSCITFLDGRCEFWPWSDPRTRDFSAGAHNVQTPENADLARLQAVLGGS